MALPIPLEPPVTTATLLVKSLYIEIPPFFFTKAQSVFKSSVQYTLVTKANNTLFMFVPFDYGITITDFSLIRKIH
ncbi:hypothetical protein EVI01_02530 [Enterococcus villorum]|uniref:Uncharacterized protein n=1 Tax=Enterococcus villorum TaxID=112904 RepID=A0A511IYQ4_9ENTE|nr:hypothetical protein EVI01_02530 [Enterococcus villorum]